jgi:hypothetical protein
MDEFVHFNENSVLALIALLLLMAIWVRATVAIDRWVRAAADLFEGPPYGFDRLSLENEKTRTRHQPVAPHELTHSPTPASVVQNGRRRGYRGATERQEMASAVGLCQGLPR